MMVVAAPAAVVHVGQKQRMRDVGMGVVNIAGADVGGMMEFVMLGGSDV
jgi:hypothetical protein